MGGIIAPGSDAGAWAVPHGAGGTDEYRHLLDILGPEGEAVVNRGICCVMAKF